MRVCVCDDVRKCVRVSMTHTPRYDAENDALAVSPRNFCQKRIAGALDLLALHHFPAQPHQLAGAPLSVPTAPHGTRPAPPGQGLAPQLPRLALRQRNATAPLAAPKTAPHRPRARALFPPPLPPHERLSSRWRPSGCGPAHHVSSLVPHTAPHPRGMPTAPVRRGKKT